MLGRLHAGLIGALVASSLLIALPAIAADPVLPTAPEPAVGVPAGLAPKAYIVVDQATGRVVAASNERQPLPPASMTKVLTALAAVAALKPSDKVPVSARAAGMPAHKLNMKPGEQWPVNDALASLLLSSANDAAAALAERVSGTLENFQSALGLLSANLQLADSPVLQDPSGLDDHFSVGGGNLISARDLAIATRALLAEPRLASLVSSPVVRFTDPGGVPHRLINHNKLLTQYFGTVGVKTGYTKKSGRGLIAAATRNGRTFIAVIMNVGDTYGWAKGLLDTAFATGVPAAGDQLPAIRRGFTMKASAPPVVRASRSDATTPPSQRSVIDDPTQVIALKPATSGGGGLHPMLQILLWTSLVLLGLVGALRTRVLMRRSRRRRRRHSNASVKHTPNRRRDPELTPEYTPRTELHDRFHEVTRG